MRPPTHTHTQVYGILLKQPEMIKILFDPIQKLFLWTLQGEKVLMNT